MAVQLLEEPERIRAALSPVRRQLLVLLREPMSATELAAKIGTTRQRLGYHLNALESAGLIEVVDERQRRGFVERVYKATANDFVIDPSAMAGHEASDDAQAQDRYAAEHLISASSETVREVTRMQAAAEGEGKRLLTFTIEVDVNLATPADLERFADALADSVATTAARFSQKGGRRYRVLLGAHPAPKTRRRKR